MWSVAASIATAVALYFGRSVLDVAWLDGRAVRMALLPPWESALGFLLLTALGLLLIDRWRRSTTPAALLPLSALVSPFIGLSVLALPFLPVLPDRWPVLQTLAGPMGLLVWLVVGGLAAWTWTQHRLVSFTWLIPTTRTRQMVLIGLATALISSTTASRFTGTVLAPAGDEPHYLIIAQSLWRDGDFKIENNHQRGDYREYFARDLDPHYLTRGSDGEIYSIHPVGLPVLLAPVYAAGGYHLVVVALIVMAATAAALMWGWVATALASPTAATFAWAVIAASSPFLFNTFTVYPEIAAALAVMIALTTGHPLVAGLACAALPWLSTKYAPMSAVLLALGCITGAGPFTWRLAPWRALAARVVPYALSLAGWFAFFYAFWGKARPQAPYGAMVQTTPWNLVFGAPGLLFDQEYGLLPYAPAYILALTGLWALWRAGGERRMLAVRVVLVFGALLGTVGAFRIWWGGSAAPGRPLTSGLLVLGLPIAAAFAAAPAQSARRAAQHLLMWIGVGVAATLALAQGGLLTANGRDGTSSLLEWWSPRVELWSLAPTFIHHEAPEALGHALVWLVAAAAGAVVLARLRVRTPERAALAAWAVCCLTIATAALIVPLLPANPPLPRIDLRARSRLAALDRYDTRALPAAVVYDPLRKTDAASMLGGLTLEVTPGARPDPQPVRVIHNGRFSLPAGTYRLDVTFDGPAPAEELSLQVGRVGPPLQTWQVEGDTSFSHTFRLPLDSNFVGVRGTRELEARVRAVAFTPLTVINAGERVHAPPVLGTALYGSTLAMLHDDQVSPERPGFWILGRRRMALSLAPMASMEKPITLNLRSRVDDNRVTLRTPGWSHTVTLMAESPVDVSLPAPRHGVVSVSIETSSGFVPADRDPAIRDKRFLGVWVEVK